MNLTNASSFRRTACGLCLLVGPLLLLIANFFDPAAGSGDDDREYLQSLKDDPEMAQLATALWIWGFALMAIGIIGVIHVIRRRGVVLANIGGAFALLGMIFFVALVTTTVNDINVAEHLGVETGEKLSDDIEDYWVAFVVLVPALLGTLIGFVLLGIAIIRSGITHIAAGVMIILGILAVAASDQSKAVAIVANALLLGGWGMVGLKLLGLKDEEWDGRVPIGAGGPEAAPAGGPPAGGAGPTPPAAPPPNV